MRLTVANTFSGTSPRLGRSSLPLKKHSTEDVTQGVRSTDRDLEELVERVSTITMKF